MTHVFVNLKRFDVPVELGGICRESDPIAWIEGVVIRSIELGLGAGAFELVFLLPEAYILPALQALRTYPMDRRRGISFGSQSVYRENVSKGGNFGAFTGSLPAASAAHIGCTWAMVGHSEERKDRLGIVNAYAGEGVDMVRAHATVDRLVNGELLCALQSGLSVLLCVGETAEQKPAGDVVIAEQLRRCLDGVSGGSDGSRVVIGYEPIWAIGPGKTPPGPDYIGHVSALIKETTRKLLGAEVPVVYGGGLKEENAAAILGVSSIDGGLVALTRFDDPIGFDPAALARIVAARA